MGCQSGDDQVVEDTAAVIGEQAVARPTHSKPLQIHRHQGLQFTYRFGTRDLNLAHVGNIKQARMGPGVQVLGNNALGKLHRHGVTGERNHPGPQLDV